MLGDDELAELRELQSRFYAPASQLSDAELDRLHVLQEKQRVPVANAAASDPLQSLLGDGVPLVEAGEQLAEAPAAEQTTARPRRTLVALAAVPLVVGGLAGWGLSALASGAAQPGAALTTQQQDRRDAFEAVYEHRLDEDSLRIEGERGSALVWSATAEDGDQVCLGLDVAGALQLSCVSAEDAAVDGPSVSLQTQANDGGDNHFHASRLRTIDDEYAIYLWSYRDAGWDWLSEFDAENRPRAESLAAQGFDEGSMKQLGSYEGLDVWSAGRDGGAQLCMVLFHESSMSECVDKSDLT